MRVPNSGKLLSICIPTYNRAPKLDRLLQRLSEEITGLEDRVEICVSDNHSGDATTDVLSRWTGHIPLVHSRNESNLGFDRNILRLVEIASGRFIWFMGDDDEISSGSLRNLVEDIAVHEAEGIDAICINIKFGRRWLLKRKGRFRVIDWKLHPERLEIGAMGSICVRKARAEKAVEGLELNGGILVKKRFGSPVLHDLMPTYIFLECLRGSKRLGMAIGYGTEMSRSCRSVRAKLYIELMCILYLLELNRYYPWVKENSSILSPSHELFARVVLDSGMAGLDKDNEVIYQTFIQALLRQLRIEGKGNVASLVSAFNAIRRIPIMKALISTATSPLLPYWNVSLDGHGKDSLLETNIRLAISKTKMLLELPEHHAGGSA